MMINGQPAPLPSQLGVRPDARLSAGLLTQAFVWMFAGLLVTAIVAWLVGTNESVARAASSLYLPLIIGQFVLVIGISAGIQKLSATVALLLFFVYAATMGVTISFFLLVYGLGAGAMAFSSASVMFGGAALYGAVTKRSLATVGGYLSMGLIGIIGASLLNGLVFKSGTTDLAISIVAVVLFVGLTAWTVQRITRGDYAASAGSMEKGAVVAALALYLNFVNLFLFLLKIFGGRRD